MSHIDPTRAQFEAFKDLPRDTPINMLNLVRFRDVAAYPEGHPDAGITGAEAYARYAAGSGPVLARVGGQIIWRGTFEAALIGAPDLRWDATFIARYPGAGAFLAMITDPEYKAAVIHRTAAVADSQLVRCAEAEPGATFG